MKTRLSPNNPLGHNRAGFAWEKVPADGRAHLDFGCHRGGFLHALAGKGPRRLAGVDVSRDAVEAGRRQYPNLELHHVVAGQPLPFDDGSFDSASILDVIEHIDNQKAVLDELHRVLEPGGLLIITTPGKYVLSFMDVGNLKFRLPRLHRLAYSAVYGRHAYQRRYTVNPDGLVGDVSADKGWHEHFTPDKLAGLIRRSGFEPIAFDGSGFLTRALSPVTIVLSRLPMGRRLLRPVLRADARLFSSMNLFCVAGKVPAGDCAGKNSREVTA